MQALPSRITAGVVFASVVAAIWGGVFESAQLFAAAPVVRTLNVRGLRLGATTTLTFDGTDLGGNPRVVMAIPIVRQEVKPTSGPNRVELDVTLDDRAPPGLHNLYLATDSGISEKLIVAVDRLPQLPFAPTVESLPVALHGTIGSGVQRVTFPGRAGESIMCEVESRRWGAKVRPVLHLYDAQGKHLAWSLPWTSLKGDTRITATIPADGLYTVTLNDLQYNAPAPNYYRLRIGNWRYADLAFPSHARRGQSVPLKLIGGGSAASPSAALMIPKDVAALAAFPPELAATPDVWSGPLPVVQVSDLPEQIEDVTLTGESPRELPSIPVAVNGWLSSPGEEDRYRLRVVPESKLRFELWAARLGAELDMQLELRRENGQSLATNDDAAGTLDAALDFTVPKDVESLVVAVRDALGKGGERAIYRLAVTSTTNPASSPPDFQLTAEQARYNIPQARRQVVRVRVERRDYPGPIRVEWPELPPGVVVEGTEIPAGATGKLISLQSTGEGTAERLMTLRGVAMAPPGPDGAPLDLVRTAVVEGDTDGSMPPWLSQQVAIALAQREGNDFDIQFQPAADAKLVLGGKLQVPVQCVRPPGFDGPVRLTLLTSQNPPQANGKDDPNRTLRSESAQPVEIPADPKAVAAWDAKLAADKRVTEAQAAVDKAAKGVADAQGAGGPALEAATKMKADADVKLAEAQTQQQAAVTAAKTASDAAKNDVAYALLVPAELADPQVELAFRAELLSRDKQRVLMTVASPVRSLPIFNPLKVTYGGPEKTMVSLDAKTGATFKITGKIERLEGIAGDATVSLVGLPAGVAVPKVVLKPEKLDFELEVKLAPNTAPGPLAGVKLFATAKMTPQSPIEVRSVEVPLAIEIMPAAPSP